MNDGNDTHRGDRLAEAQSFLQALFGHEHLDGLHFGLFTLPRANSHWFEDPEQMAQRAIELSDDHDVYVRLTPLRQQPAGHSRGGANDAAALVCLYCEIDIGTAGHGEGKSYPPDEESVRELLRAAVPLDPTYIIHSGGGWHVYWLLGEPMLLMSAEDRATAAALVLRLQRTIAAEATKRGWSVDSTFDLARVLRVPGTVNHKLDGHPRPVRVIETSDRRYQPDDFEDILIVLELEEADAADISVCLVTGDGREPPPRKLEALLAREGRFKATWEHRRQDLGDPSLSGYDLALAGAAARAGWEDQEIADLIGAFRDRHGVDDRDRAKGQRADYLARTIARARSKRPVAPVPMPVFDGPLDLQLRATHAHQTPTRATVEFELWRGGEYLTDLSATDTMTGGQRLGKAMLEELAARGERPDKSGEAAIRSFARRVLSKESVAGVLRAVTARQQAALEDTLAQPSMIDIATEHLRDELDLRFVEDDKGGTMAWSESRGALVSQRSITSERDPALLEHLKQARDYAEQTPGDPSKPIRHLAFTMQVVWTALTKPLPREAGDTGLDEASRAAERFRGQMMRLWLTTGTWATEPGEGYVQRHSAQQRRTSFAGRAAAEAKSASPGVWHPVLQDVRAYFAVTTDGGPRCVWLGLHHDIIHHGVKGAELPGVVDADSLHTLVERYGLVASDLDVSAALAAEAGRKHIVVLSQAFTRRVLDEEPETRSHLHIDGHEVDPTTGEVLDAG